MKKVLYVEDNPEMIEIVQIVLQNSGYRILTTQNGDEVITLCREEQPDLVLMDLNMPTLDGFEITRQLRQAGFDRPIVALTASESDEDRSKARRAGCDDYVLKTLDMADLEKTIDSYIAEAGGL